MTDDLAFVTGNDNQEEDMAMTNLLAKRKELPEYALADAAAWVRHWMRVPRDVDPARLKGDEQHELIALQARCSFRNEEGGGGINLDRLEAGQKKELERLVGKMAGDERLYDRLRDEAKLRKEFRKIGERARMGPRRIRYEERGSIRLGRAVFLHLAHRPVPALFVRELGVLAFVLLCLENGRALSPGARIEGSGDEAALVLDHEKGLGPFAADYDDLIRWKKDLDHLARNKWILLERKQNGHELWIRRGPRSLAALTAGAKTKT